MKKFIIDFITESGRKDFICVNASTPESAVEVFRSSGISWTGTDFETVEIIAVNER